MHNHIRFARFITRLLDTSFGVGRFRFGLEPLLGLFPVVGDIIGLIFSFYIVWIGKKIEIPEKEIVRMTRNIVFDFVGGLIPFLGDVFDFAFRANSKNMAILEKYLTDDVLEGKVLSS